MPEITLEELEKLDKDTYELVDMRDALSFEYGRIEGAVSIPQTDFDENKLDKTKKTVLYCKSGVLSVELADTLCEHGFDACSLKDGYIGWLRRKIQSENDDIEFRERVENSIRKKFHKELFSRFAAALNEYELLKENDRVAVCISGGKDSMLMAKLFQELVRHRKFHFELVFLVMDPGYSSENREIIEHNAKRLGIPITVFESTIFDAVYNVEKSPCYLCARMRRGYLYSKAKELGCNKIALGHHFDDAVETFIMNLFNEGRIGCFSPVTYLDKSGITLLRPLIYSPEKDIKYFINHSDLPVMKSPCPADKNSERQRVKDLLRDLEKKNKGLKHRIFGAMQRAGIDGFSYPEKTHGTDNQN